MEKQICTRCIVDETVPGANFDEKGLCAYCRLHDILEKEYPLGEEGEKRLGRVIEKMKKAGRGKKWDCVAGISGGRDSTYSLYLLVKKFGLRPLAVHFNDGFGNPTAGMNMQRTCDQLGVELRTITSDWRESKDLKISFLKASTPDMEEATDIGIATSLYGTAAKENIKYIVIGQSFRTEGVAPLEWNYLDGRYLKAVHKMFGSYPLRQWKPDDPSFNLDIWHMFYYTIIRGIHVVAPFYFLDYIRSEVDKIIVSELGWVNTGAHYYDDLYQSLMHQVYRSKFGIDRRKYNWSALVRSGQMDRELALERLKEPYALDDPDIIRLCVKRLGLSQEQFDGYMKLPVKTFRDYPSSYRFIRAMRIPIWFLTVIGLLPKSAYAKYFKCG